MFRSLHRKIQAFSLSLYQVIKQNQSVSRKFHRTIFNVLQHNEVFQVTLQALQNLFSLASTAKLLLNGFLFESYSIMFDKLIVFIQWMGKKGHQYYCMGYTVQLPYLTDLLNTTQWCIALHTEQYWDNIQRNYL